MSVLPAEPLTEFHDAIQSPVTESTYDKRLALFLAKLDIKGDLKV